MTRTTVPTAPRIDSAQSRSAEVTCEPPAIALTPWRISTGVLGMDRTTATGELKTASMRWVERPATTESRRVAPQAAARRAAPSA